MNPLLKIGEPGRHGDVLVRRIEKIPEQAVRVDSQKTILAYGEASGHSHHISDGLAAIFEFEEKRYLEIVYDLGTLSHEEHAAKQLPKGSYEIFIQRQHEPAGWTNVID